MGGCRPGRAGEASSVSFTDGLNGQTTYAYHAQLTGLHPGTTYYYQVSDGSSTPATAGSQFETAPAARARYRFSSYGDLATPSWDLNASGNIWHESCDNSYYAVSAIENPGDGRGAPLFHLLNGDLCYANAKGAAVDTRRPTVVTTKPGQVSGLPAWNTAEGTVFLVLGGGTNGPTNTYGEDTADDKPQAKVITERNAITGSEAAGFTRNAADSVEDAPWSAAINASDAYGYAIFDVDPGHRRGETTITMQYFAIPAVSNEAGSAHDGTTTLPSAPTETFVFGRKVKHG